MPDAPTGLVTALADRYTIERELGQGGMATVYLAHDIRHGRKVALKVLHPELAAVIGAERFLQEIKTTANLQHPHIPPLHDSGAAEGFLFYVMSYVDGETLRARLLRERQLPVDAAVGIAREVAGVLAYAHAHGVVHRDIKPENILLQGGHALVADFGIALAVETAGGQRMTQTGLSLGTPQYMAPEQAMGERNLDARTDVYALGCVLYEMLTGEPPFTGATSQAIVARVMTEEPRPLAPQRKSVPPHVEAAVLKALEKVPADRFGTAAEFDAALEDERPVTRRVPARGVRTRGRHLTVALAAACLVLAAALAWSLLRSSARAELPLLTARIVAAAEAPSDLRQVALSPDGTWLAYVSSAAIDGGRIWLRNLGDGTARALAETEGARLPFWAPDGSALGFFSAGSLKVISLGSGAVRTLAPAPNPAPSAAWSSNGTIVYNPFFNGLWHVPAAGGEPQRFAGAAKDDREVSFLPDGHHFLFWRSGGGRAAVFLIGDLETGEAREIGNGISSPKYVAPGYVFFFQSNTQAELEQPAPLFAQRFDTGRLTLVGEPVTLSPRVDRPFQIAAFSVTPDLLVMRETRAPAEPRAHGALYWLDRATGRRNPVNGAGPTWTFRVSHDGRRVAFGGVGLWLYDPQRDVAVRVPTKAPAPWPPVWSPDDRHIAVVNGPQISVIPVDGSGPERVLDASDDPAWADPVDWSPDGSAIYFIREPAAQRPHWELWRHVLASGHNEQVPTGPGHVFDARLSPDGGWIAWESDASGRREVYLGPTAGSAATLRVSKAGGGSPHWRRDGRELFYIGGDGRIVVVSTRLGARPVIGEPVRVSDAVVHPEPFGTDPFRDTRFDISPSGDRLLVQTPPDLKSYQLTLIQGWRTKLPR